MQLIPYGAPAARTENARGLASEMQVCVAWCRVALPGTEAALHNAAIY
jgi:hypothetical protein